MTSSFLHKIDIRDDGQKVVSEHEIVSEDMPQRIHIWPAIPASSLQGQPCVLQSAPSAWVHKNHNLQSPESRPHSLSISYRPSCASKQKYYQLFIGGGGCSISDWGYHQGTSIGVPETAALTAVVAETRDVIWLGMVGPLNNCKYH